MYVQTCNKASTQSKPFKLLSSCTLCESLAHIFVYLGSGLVNGYKCNKSHWLHLTQLQHVSLRFSGVSVVWGGVTNHIKAFMLEHQSILLKF